MPTSSNMIGHIYITELVYKQKLYVWYSCCCYELRVITLVAAVQSRQVRINCSAGPPTDFINITFPSTLDVFFLAPSAVADLGARDLLIRVTRI